MIYSLKNAVLKPFSGLGYIALSLGVTLSLSAMFVKADSVMVEETALSLSQAISLAQQNDPWLQGNKFQQQAVQHRSVASGQLPDPTVSVSMMNLPTNSWDVNQEAMTQFKVGVAQMFPRGDSLAIKQQQLQIEADKFPLLRADRKARLQSKVSELWLDAWLAQQTINLIQSEWALFEQMAEVARASYSNAVGQTRQQDVIRAQLEIVQLQDLLTVQQQKAESAMALLNEWLQVYDRHSLTAALNFESHATAFRVSETLPEIPLTAPSSLQALHFARHALAQVLMEHPAVRALDVKIQVSGKDIDLARQQYKPQWGVNASYGYRDNMPSGDSRADLFSVGVSFDVPLFTENRQDKQLAASVAETEAVKTEKLLLTRQMISLVEKELKQLQRLSERQALYQDQILTQSHEQAEASLTAYTNDDGDFAEVVRARIAELNARIAALQIDVETLKTRARLNYFFADAESVPLQTGE